VGIGYRGPASVLRDAIQAGTYPAGSTLPKQDEIASEHGVNVNTVRKAVSVLEADGLVAPVRRKGTVVRARLPMRRLGIERYAKSKRKFGLVGFVADREAFGRAWKRDDQANTVRLAEADADAAEALGVEPGPPLYERARLIKDT
jgi:GntR family transcriptional regulator